MAISFVDSAVGSASPNASTVITLPGGMSAGDFIFVLGAVADNADNGLAAPTEGGYTDVLGASDLYSNDSNDVNLDLFYKFHNGTDTTCTFAGVGGTNASNVGVLMVFRGVKSVVAGGPFDTAVTTATGIDASDPNPPSHNWSGAAGVWTVIGGATGYSGTGSGTYTFPSGYTTDAAQRDHQDTFDCHAGMGYNSSPADPEDPGAMVTGGGFGTTANNAWAAFTASLSPAPPGSLAFQKQPLQKKYTNVPWDRWA